METSTIIIILIVIFLVLPIIGTVIALIIYFVLSKEADTEKKKIVEQDNKILAETFSFTPTGTTDYATSQIVEGTTVGTSGNFLQTPPLGKGQSSDCKSYEWRYGTYTNGSNTLEDAIILQKDPTKILCHYNYDVNNKPGVGQNDFVLIYNPYEPKATSNAPTNTTVPASNCQWVRNQKDIKTWCLKSDTNVCMQHNVDPDGKIKVTINDENINFDLSPAITPPNCNA